MSWAQLPTDDELQEFAERLHTWRHTLGEGEQRLVDSLVAVALGQWGETDAGERQPMEHARAEDQPRGNRAARERGSWCASRWLATPWGMMHTVHYS